MIRYQTVALALLCVLFTTLAQISLKIGVSAGPAQAALQNEGLQGFLLRALLQPFVIAGFALYVLSTFLWLLVLARADVSFAYPFVSLGFVLIAMYAYYFLGEPMAPARLGGIVLISAGVWLVSRS